MGENVAEIIGPILAHFNAKFDILQRNIDNKFERINLKLDEMTNQREPVSNPCLESMLSISNESRMTAQLETLRKNPDEVAKEELKKLEEWAGPENGLKSGSNTLKESFTEPEIDIQAPSDGDNSSRCSFSILPSNIPTEEVKEEDVESINSTDSFEEITSNIINDLNKSDSTIENNDEEEEKQISELASEGSRRSSIISNEEMNKISLAVSAQARAIQELMNSNKFSSISRSNSIASGVSTPRQEETVAEIQKIAQECLESGMIKKSANEGLVIPPVNSRATSMDPNSIPVSINSANNTVWIPSDFSSATSSINGHASGQDLPSYQDTIIAPTRPLPKEPEWKPDSLVPAPLPQVFDEDDFQPAHEILTQLNPEATDFQPQSEPNPLEINLNADSQILENMTSLEQTAHPVHTGQQRTIDFTPVNGLQQLRREFGDEYEFLYGVCLRKFDYDAGRAAEFIRQGQVTSAFLAAKMHLNDYGITPEDHSLSEMVVHIDNINEIISAYIEHEFQERTIVNVPNGRAPQRNLWDNVRRFVSQTLAPNI